MLQRQTINAASVESPPQHAETAAEWYERGLALRKAGLFKQAIEQFQKVAGDEGYGLRAYAQMGLCYKSNRQYDEAVASFRNALKMPGASTKQTVQLLYVLGRTLESIGRSDEALEAYRWLRREDAKFRDVTERIESLGERRRMRTGTRSAESSRRWSRQASEALHALLWSSK